MNTLNDSATSACTLPYFQSRTSSASDATGASGRQSHLGAMARDVCDLLVSAELHPPQERREVGRSPRPTRQVVDREHVVLARAVRVGVEELDQGAGVDRERLKQSVRDLARQLVGAQVVGGQEPHGALDCLRLIQDVRGVGAELLRGSFRSTHVFDLAANAYAPASGV